MNKKLVKLFLVILFFSSVIFFSCSENVIDNSNNQNTGTLLYERNGLIDSVVGTCSTFLIRNIFLDTLNLELYSDIRMEFNAFTDGDLSSLSIYYIQDSTINLFELNGLEITNTQLVIIPSPNLLKDYYLRLKLYSSFCTGQLFVLSVRDLKIYGN